MLFFFPLLERKEIIIEDILKEKKIDTSQNKQKKNLNFQFPLYYHLDRTETRGRSDKKTIIKL
jgi:hypothetical protein